VIFSGRPRRGDSVKLNPSGGVSLRPSPVQQLDGFSQRKGTLYPAPSPDTAPPESRVPPPAATTPSPPAGVPFYCSQYVMAQPP
jgi:hypothetical protein